MSPAPAAARYHDLVFLGRGGMGEVHLSLEVAPDGSTRLLVRKRLRLSLADDATVLRMFAEEARLAVRLHHPNIVESFALGTDTEGAKRQFLTMEYLEGESLHAILRRHHELGRRFPIAMELRVLSDTLAGLHHAHALTGDDGAPLGLVHRDATPSNLFVTYAGAIKVVDFGIAKVAGSHTTTGVIKGKIAYVAPEQVSGRAIDRRADVFTVGVLLYEALTQRRLWAKIGDMEILKRLDHGEIPKLAESGLALPPALVSIVDRALAMKPDDRYPTAEDMRADLEAYVTASGEGATALEVGAYVAEMFADTRAKMRVVIASAIRSIGDGDEPGDDRHSPRRQSSFDLRAGAKTAAASMPTPMNAELSDAGTSMSTAGARRSERRVLFATAAATLLIVGVGLGLLGMRNAAPKSIPTTASQEPGAAASVSASVHAPEQTTLDVVVFNAPAPRVFVDDHEIAFEPAASKGTLFGFARATLPRDSGAHRVRVEAAGFAPTAQWVTADRGSRSLNFSLTAVPSASSSAPRSSAPSVAPLDTADPWRR